MIMLTKDSKRRTGFNIQVRFAINVHSMDRPLLEKLYTFFGRGQIDRGVGHTCIYRVISVKDIVEVVIPHFDKYPLLSKKKADFLLFKCAAELIFRKEHLTQKGVEEIIRLKASSNLGLNELLKNEFRSLVPAIRPQVEFSGEIPP